MNIQNLVLDINKKPFQTITANKGEVGSRFIRITIVDNSTPVDLTGVTVSLYAKKPDGKKVFNSVTVEDKANGTVLAELTSQILSVAGLVRLTLLLVKNGSKLASKQFFVNVDESIVDDEAIESTNEFTALVDALGRVNNIDSRFEKVDSQLAHIENDRISINMFPRLENDKDDTERIQRALNFCSENNKSLFFDGGLYICRQINVPTNVSIYGNGSTFKKPKLNEAPYNYTVEQMKWSYIFNVVHKSDEDSPLITIDGCNFDGNCYSMWSPSDGHSQEQASLLIAYAWNHNKGRLNINISNCSFRNNVSDGIHIVVNTNATISNCNSYDCFRGGLTITGGNSNINVNGWISRSDKLPDGFDIEVDSKGHNDVYKSYVNVSNVVIDNDFDIGCAHGSVFNFENVTMTGKGIWYLTVFENSTLRLKNCILYMKNRDSNTRLFSRCGDVYFENCTFRAANSSNGDSNIYLLPITFGYLSPLVPSIISFNGCRFEGRKDLTNINGIAFPNNNLCTMKINNCYFDENVVNAIGGGIDNVAPAIKRLEVSNTIFNNKGVCISHTRNLQPSGQAETVVNNIQVINSECATSMSSGGNGMKWYINNVNLQYGLNFGGRLNEIKTGSSFGINVQGGRNLYTNISDPNNVFNGCKNDTVIIVGEDNLPTGQEWIYSSYGWDATNGKDRTFWKLKE